MMRKLLFVLLAGALLAFGYYGFIEFYYYRDKVDWLSPFPPEAGLQIRKDHLGKGHFGARRSGGRRHKGVDLLAEEGEPVLATRSGRARVGYVPKGMGKFVTLFHRDDYQTIYGHLSEVTVKDRSRVRQGQVIGAVGKTGNASSGKIKPHLHFEVRQGGKVLDPIPLLTQGDATTRNAFKEEEG